MANQAAKKWAKDIAKGCQKLAQDLGIRDDIGLDRIIQWQAKSMEVVAEHMSMAAQMDVSDELQKITAKDLMAEDT